MKDMVINLLTQRRDYALRKQTEAQEQDNDYSEGFWRGVALQASDAINLIDYIDTREGKNESY